MATSPGPSAAPNAEQTLEQFIFKPDQFEMNQVPRPLEPGEVAKFIRKRMDKQAELKAWGQAEKVIDYYDLYEVSDLLWQMLDKSEVTVEEHKRSIVIARALARVGDAADRAYAKDYYLHLIGRANSVDELEMLASLYEALGGEAESKPLVDKVTHRKRSVEPRATEGAAARHDLRRLNELLEQTIPRAEQANGVKARVLAQKARKARIDELVRIYTAQQAGYPEYLPAWAARRLRRETWAEQPVDQTRRAAKPALRQDVADAFRSAFNTIEASKKIPGDEKAYFKTMCLHAIEFFGGEISEEERQFLNERANTQWDVLANS